MPEKKDYSLRTLITLRKKLQKAIIADDTEKIRMLRDKIDEIEATRKTPTNQASRGSTLLTRAVGTQ